MNTISWTPESSEVSSVYPQIPTPDTVIASSHADALAALDINKYTQLMAEVAEMIWEGKTSREIITHLWKSLNIEKWGKEEFLGECEFVPTPTETEIPRLREYLKTLGIEWSLANGGSDNHPEFFLMDGQIPQALVGAENMKKTKALLAKIHDEWQATRKDESQKKEEYDAKETLLKKYLGLSEVHWKKLIGLRGENGKFQGGDGVRITGELSEDKKKVERIWVTQDGERGGSVVASSPAHYSGLFALAQVAPKGE